MDYKESLRRFQLLAESRILQEDVDDENVDSEPLVSEEDFFDPQTIYNVYYAIYLSQMYPQEDFTITADDLRQTYLGVFLPIVKAQIKKYISFIS